MPNALPPKNTMCQHYQTKEVKLDKGNVWLVEKRCTVCNTLISTKLVEKE
jgi:hypothetical protein